MQKLLNLIANCAVTFRAYQHGHELKAGDRSRPMKERMEANEKAVRNRNYAKMCETVLQEYLDEKVIPPNVFYDRRSDNFFDRKGLQVKDFEFWERWHSWRNYFPERSHPNTLQNSSN